MMLQCKQRGIVLIATMIFLFILSLLVITEIENNSYEHRMMGHYKNRAIAFADAEIVMNQLARNLIDKNSLQPPVQSQIQKTIKIENNTDDKTTYYLLRVIANYRNAQVKLQSYYAISITQKNNFQVKQLYWRELQ
jgi:Tfp pilus assembly protein PilX